MWSPDYCPLQLKKRRETVEQNRLEDSYLRKSDWKNWGPYVSDRAWGTVREDYSPSGEAWSFFPHDHARSRAYRWNEDGIAGVCNRFQNLCLGIALWNGKDPIIKERFFGVTGAEGNHGEDVKEYYFYLDNTPTHSYMKMLYKYPQAEFPYQTLIEENRKRTRFETEFELVDTNIFQNNSYFDVFVEYAKADQDDLLCTITVYNRGSTESRLEILPHIWFRNYWSWGYPAEKPLLQCDPLPSGPAATNHDCKSKRVICHHKHLGTCYYYLEETPDNLLFTENNTNYQKLFGTQNESEYVKDGINDFVIGKDVSKVNWNGFGTKCCAQYSRLIAPNGGSYTIKIRFSPQDLEHPFKDYDQIFEQRLQEANDFWAHTQCATINAEHKLIQRQAFAGLLWSKQYYHYGVQLWLDGDNLDLKPPPQRKKGRNAHWEHFYANDVISMPDKWEYPWFAAWDLAFHAIPISVVDPEWAKRQLTLILREWYMHPSGLLPAYEWNFGDVNPPVHAWATLKVFQITEKLTGYQDIPFLEKVFHKLLLNFTWWVNRKDTTGNNIFEGGFLGLDNIGVFDRSAPLPTGGFLQQADGTSWMAMYCLNMLAIAVELAFHNPSYEDIATKFLEHFIYIAHSISNVGHTGTGLWDPEDGFFYDQIKTSTGEEIKLRLRTFVGLIPLFAVEILESNHLEKLQNFKRRFDWFVKYRPHLVANVADLTAEGSTHTRLLSIVSKEKMGRIFQRMFDSSEFFSDYGLRALSRYHLDHPFVFEMGGETKVVRYEPAESSSPLFGGNSNWRGPIWLPVNYLMIESLKKYHRFYGDSYKIEVPTGSGNLMTLAEAANELSRRLTNIFAKDPNSGKRPVFGGEDMFNSDELWKDHILFYEYFHGDNGAGIGASHQTGWTALIADLIDQLCV